MLEKNKKYLQLLYIPKLVKMEDLMNYLFGPLEKSYYCNFFLVITIFIFVFFVFSMIVLGYQVFYDKGVSAPMLITTIGTVTLYFILYLQSRIMYSVCLGTIGSQ